MTQRSTTEVLFTNDRFYSAFANGNMTDMEALWGDEGSVCCIHPGWSPLYDRSQIIASWNAILQHPSEIQCADPKILPLGQDGIAIICQEIISSKCFIATNLYRCESGIWKIIHHQAGPIQHPPFHKDISKKYQPSVLN